MNGKELEDILGKDTLKALDERYIRGGVDIGAEECETNPIVAKKQKIADFYKSLDDDEKLLLGMICEVPTTASGRDKVMSMYSGNPCKDYSELISMRLENLINKIFKSEGVIPKMTGLMPFFHF